VRARVSAPGGSAAAQSTQLDDDPPKHHQSSSHYDKEGPTRVIDLQNKDHSRSGDDGGLLCTVERWQALHIRIFNSILIMGDRPYLIKHRRLREDPMLLLNL